MVTPDPTLRLRGTGVGVVIIPGVDIAPRRWYRRCSTNVRIFDTKVLTTIFYEFGAQGTACSSFLGAATINLVDYADASQPPAISLPLVGSDHGTIVHFEEQRDKGLQSGNNSSSKLEMLDDQEMNKTQETNIHEECSNSRATSDGSSNASENYNTHDVYSVKSKVSVSQSPPIEELHKDLAIDFEENHRLEGSLDAAKLSITELKMELSLLQSHANEMGNETQKFSQELASEISLGQGLSKEVTFLKSECSKLKTDPQKLSEMKSSSQFIESNIEKSHQVKKVKWVDGVLLVEDQIRNLQEKVYAGSHEPHLRVLKSDLEVKNPWPNVDAHSGVLFNYYGLTEESDSNGSGVVAVESDVVVLSLRDGVKSIEQHVSNKR
nr:hypothetical protein [Tanacetum cinerariifolium]